MHMYYKAIKDFKMFSVLLNNGSDFTKASNYLFETQTLGKGSYVVEPHRTKSKAFGGELKYVKNHYSHKQKNLDLFICINNNVISLYLEKLKIYLFIIIIYYYFYDFSGLKII